MDDKFLELRRPDVTMTVQDIIDTLAAERISIAQREAAGGTAVVFVGERGRDLLRIVNQALAEQPKKEKRNEHP